MKLHRALFGIGGLLAIHLAQAGPPFVTDDPEPPPPAGWEINVPFILERTPGTTPKPASVLTWGESALSCCAEVHVPAVVVVQIYCRSRDLRSNRLQRTTPAATRCSNRFA